MRKFLALALVFAMLLSFAACGTKETATESQTAAETATTTTETTTQTSAQAESVTVETTEVTSDVEYAKSVTIALVLGDLDPGVGWNAQREGYQRFVFDTLLFHDDVTGEDTMQLAKSVEWADDTNTKLHVVLRDDIVFSNGDPLTAEDCVFSFDRTTYSGWTDFYAGCENVSDYEFDINLSMACSDINSVLSRACCCIVNKAEAEADPDGLALIGTGPYVYDMSSHVAGNTITLKRNDLFWGEQNPTEEVKIVTMEDASAAGIALQNGELNLVFNLNAEELPTLAASENVETTTYTSYNFIYLAFNDHKDSTKLTEEEKNFRRAVACAINKEDIVSAVGGGSVMTCFWQFDHPAYISSESEYEHDLSYNPEQAKAYLEQAGGKTEFTVLVDTSRSWCKLAAQIIQEYCRQVGITMNIEETDGTGFKAMTKWDTLECEANLWSNLFLDCLDNRSYLMGGANSNRAQMIDPEVDDALNSALTATSDEEKNEYYRIALKKTHENVSWLPLIFREMNFGYTTGLEGFSLTCGPTFILRDIRLRTN